jgi:heparosan-N-sulfate-glucuronate 5-epimerase
MIGIHNSLPMTELFIIFSKNGYNKMHCPYNRHRRYIGIYMDYTNIHAFVLIEIEPKICTRQSISIFTIALCLSYISSMHSEGFYPASAYGSSSNKNASYKFDGTPPIELDNLSIPIVKYNWVNGIYIGPQRNAVIVIHTALDFYKAYKKNANETSKQAFLNNVKWLESNAIQHGNYSILEYRFPWPPYHLSPPWHSGMAQGQALQVFIRAYQITGQSKYLSIAKMLLNSFFVDVEDGGVTYKTPNNGWWYEEYAGKNSTESLVLNGMIFAVLGIYDYYTYTHDSKAKYLFDQGIIGLKNNLPYYDDNGYSFYDILGAPSDPDYHKLHIRLLSELYDITKAQIFKQYYDRWKNYNGSSTLTFPHAKILNLIDKKNLWKPFNPQTMVQNTNGGLEIIVKTNNTRQIFNRAFVQTKIEPTAKSLVLSLEYASASYKGEAKFYAEIRGNGAKIVDTNSIHPSNSSSWIAMLWGSALGNTMGKFSTKNFFLPKDIIGKPLEFRFYIITNEAGRHILTIKNAYIRYV